MPQLKALIYLCNGKIKNISRYIHQVGMNTVFLSLGGNQGLREWYLCEAMQRIERSVGSIRNRSSVYETAPWGSDSNAQYLNMVVVVETPQSAGEVLKNTQAIENVLERKRDDNRNSDRTIDIDILLFNTEIIETVEMTIPHPRLHLRNFVLVPLAEIAGREQHPKMHKTFMELATDCEDRLEVNKVAGVLDCGRYT